MQYVTPGGHVCTRFLIQGTAFNSWRGFVFYSDWYRRFVLSRKQTSQNRFWCWDDTDKHRYIQEKTKCTLIKGCAISFNSTAIRDALLNTCMLKFMLQSRTVMKSSSIFVKLSLIISGNGLVFWWICVCQLNIYYSSNILSDSWMWCSLEIHSRLQLDVMQHFGSSSVSRECRHA